MNLSNSVPKANPKNLDGVLKWVGTGFTLVVAILTFFGIKDGVLTSIVRTEPDATLGVFFLVGLSVVLALIIPVLAPSPHVQPWLLLLVIAGIFFATSWLAPDLPQGVMEPWRNYLTWIVLVVLIALAWISQRVIPDARLEWSIALLVVALTCLGCGLWTVTKISVLQTMKLDTGVVVATLKAVDGATSVELAASGTALVGPLRVQVRGTRAGAAEPATIGEVVLMPNQAGGLSATAQIPLGTLKWNSVIVRTCQEFNRYLDRTGPCTNFIDQSTFTFASPERGLRGTLSPAANGKKVSAAVAGEGLLAASHVDVQVTRGRRSVASVRVRVGDAGSMSWSETLKTAKKAPTWRLTAKVCAPGVEGAAEVCSTEQLASLDLSDR